MPVKRRAAKRRLDQHAELEAWSGLFAYGADFFGDLYLAGIVAERRDHPDEEMVRDAWQRLGAAFLASHLSDPRQEPWALRTLGEPQCR